MNPPQQITPTDNPTIGPVKLALIALATVVIVGLVLQVRVPASKWSLDLHRVEMLPAGALYGLVAAGCWLATIFDHRFLRLLVRGALMSSVAYLFGLLREDRVWIIIAADLSGLMLVQCAIFFCCQVPDWRFAWPGVTGFKHDLATSQSGNKTLPNPATKNQFGIADIAIGTFVVAVLMSLVLRYAAPTTRATFWIVESAVWLGGATITMLIAKGMTSANLLTAALLVALSAATAGAGTYAVAIADAVVEAGVDLNGDRNPIRWNEVEGFVSFYGRIVVGFWSTFTFAACFARIKSAAPKTA